MKPNETTTQQVERALKKVASKFKNIENFLLTDLILQVKQESGELLVFDDNDQEITRCVVEEWIGNTQENFYQIITPLLRTIVENMRDTFENLSLLKPYSVVLVDDDKETVDELCLFDDDLLVLDGELMDGLSDDLDAFWEELSKK